MSPHGPIPYERIPEETWSRLTAAAAERSHPMRLCTLATTTAAGAPDARLLVLRGAHRDTAQLWFHTDRRSRKTLQLAQRPEVCIIAYDPRDGIQLRLRGRITIRSTDHIAEQHWQQTELAIRHAYSLDAGPGQPLPVRDPRMTMMASRQRSPQPDEDHKEATGRANFAVLEAALHEIEWLQVRETGDRRAILHATNDWNIIALSP